MTLRRLGIHLNRFSIPKAELSGSAIAKIPGYLVANGAVSPLRIVGCRLEGTVYNYELGVGQLPGHAFINIAGVVDLSPYEGEPASEYRP